MSSSTMTPCCLVLADGSVFPGKSFGAQVHTEGEVGKPNIQLYKIYIYYYNIINLLCINVNKCIKKHA